MRKFVFILIISIFICQRCKKKTEPIITYTFRIPQQLYDYAYFKVGTYWVYQDSVTSIIDSVYVTYAKEGVYENVDQTANHYKGTFGYFRSIATSSYDHYKYENWVDQNWNVNGVLALEKYSYTVVNREKFITSGSGSNYGTAIFTSDVEVGKKFYSYLDYIEFQQLYSNFTVKTHTFGATQKWYNGKSILDDKQNTYYYISKNIGIVRREQLDSNHIWNLIRYNIVQ